MNEIEIINNSLEKSNLILKKYKLLIKNNYKFDDKKSIKVANELIEHLTKTYSYSIEEIFSLVKSYTKDEELIMQLGGLDNARFIAESIKNILKEE